ncbi:MAG: phosphate acetyltransferase [Actinomycetes bacterium]
MAAIVYVTSMEARAGKAVVALGLMELMAGRVGRIAVFRPVIADPGPGGEDALITLLRDRYQLDQSYEDCYALTYEQASQLLNDGDVADVVAPVVEAAAKLRERFDLVVCLGTDFTGPFPATELELNATLAANLGAPVLEVVPAHDASRINGVLARVAGSRKTLEEHGCSLVATVLNRVPPEEIDILRDVVQGPRRATLPQPDAPVYALPDLPVLAALTIAEVSAGLSATVVAGRAGLEQREVDGYVVGSGYLATVLPRLTEGALVVASADRLDLVLAAAAASAGSGRSGATDAGTTRGGLSLPTPAGVLLTCYDSAAVEAVAERDGDLLRTLAGDNVPVLLTDQDSYHAVHRLEQLRGEIRPGSRRKIAAAVGEFAAGVDVDELAARVVGSSSEIVTPAMFSFALLERARRQRRRIVLPEGDDDRVLQAAEEALHSGIADLTILGDPDGIAARAARLGVDLTGAQLVDPRTSEWVESFARVYTDRRAHRGMRLDLARETVTDVSYFGTLMVACGHADGMVSGAAHTTAATIRPALEVISTARGVSLVSSSFLMCLPDRVLVFGDCAVNVKPTAQQLAEIASCSADTARAFGIEPRVAMVSYSTGGSGSGEEVDRVREATEILRTAQPSLPLVGPIQYDAALVPEVGERKLPGDPVAGRATVLVFPDLNTGNVAYKAVQRAADAIAVGPVLQGLARPVNDLSRGCSVDDIVNTIAITAIQAQTPPR